MRDKILLDTASSVSLFGNKEYVEGIKKSKQKLELHTNGGPIISSETASVDKIGKVWYNTNSVANIISFADLQKRYRITYDSTVEDAFVVHTPDKPLKFRQLANGLYSYNPKKQNQNRNPKGTEHFKRK